MLADASNAGTDDWWLVRLAKQLGDGLPRMKTITSHRDGDALLPTSEWGSGTNESYKRFAKRARLHVVETVRDSRTDRQRVTGFRTGVADDLDGDPVAWRLWKQNGMKVQERKLFNDTGDYGRASILTIPTPEGPVFNVRNEWNTISEPDSLRPWLTAAAVTYGFDSVLGEEVLTLHRPGYFRRASRPGKVPTLPQDGSTWNPGTTWTWREAPQPTGVLDCLVQTYRTTDGYGIYEKHLDTVERINEITLNALTLIVMQSFRQRAIKGDLPDTYPEGHERAGEKINYDEIFQAGPAALWLMPKAAEIWESASTDVTPIYNARREELKTLSSLTRTPQDIFDSQSSNQTAQGAQSSREPLQHGVLNMNAEAELTISTSMALAFQLMGDNSRGFAADFEVIWAKPTPATLAEKADAAAKYKTGGATQRIIDTEVFELTPAQQAEANQDRVAEAFVNSLGQPPVTAAPGARN